MNLKLDAPVRGLELVHGYFSAEYMKRLFPEGECKRQSAIPKREEAPDEYARHQQGMELQQ